MKYLLFLALVFSSALSGQSTFPFDLILEPENIATAPGLQSYAKASYNGEWLILGGRTDGLHQRQPWQSFNAAGHHLNAVVINPVSGAVNWAPLSGIGKDTVEAQLSSTNSNFTQVGDLLYVLGGYGLSAGAVHITHPMLTVVNVPAAIASIKANGALNSSDFVSFSDQDFAVTGGKLMHLDSTFWLVGGQRFDGQYNPMGHNTYTQNYTESVLPFTVSGTFPNLSVSKATPIVDTNEFHRRDYNVTYMTDGSEFFMNLWSGVFQKTVDLPFLNAVEMHDTIASPVQGFSQYLNHYHCPTLSLFGENQNAMYTLFFGGIAQYYYSNGTLTQDNNVPFINTIGIVEKRNGLYSETKSLSSMPGLLGAGAEFFLDPSLPQEHQILKADSLIADTVWVGHIYGGISSPSANVFFSGMTNSSTASSSIYRVGLIRNSSVGFNEQIPPSSLQLLVAPNPSVDQLLVQLHTQQEVNATIQVLSLDGKLLFEEQKVTHSGKNNLNLGLLKISPGTYVLRVLAGSDKQQIRFNWH
jgi:hypothetical protein